MKTVRFTYRAARGRVTGYTCSEPGNQDGEYCRRAEVEAAAMNRATFGAFLDLLMCCDPWPVSDRDDVQDPENQKLVEDYIEAEAKRRGFDSWLDAYRTGRA